MKYEIRVTPVRKAPPDLERFVSALLAFVLARRAEEATKRAAEAGDGDG